MSRTGTLILLGILIILVPFSGLPIAIRAFLVVVLGASVSTIGLIMRARDARTHPQAPHEASPDGVSPATEPAPPSGVSPI